ncbi:GNAT family N-acetyltransferase [Pseudodesulfovibrio piezophilus]|uniref:N-acetyltransferase domain-containing protein n=1 Tax=Pseudodesulfovibrio piezophilus (strain DSM 21447 / JCM 15486 / C1TLV30) TaxID=1322246 RepID=M1WJW5_PSEP2|nr:GNAT family N-acetyltransferase [Pseudodesulfovibrio piezophilus]CCH48596.1 conserved protein of unknown function [Pseudodesulfovibrio piezophilus C1TLV30]
MFFKEIQPRMADAHLIMDWRNDPVTLQMFYHSSPKKMPEFYTEYLEEYFHEKQCPAVFAFLNDVPVAFLRFEEYQDLECVGRAMDISINVNPAERKKGMGVQVLKAAMGYLRERGISCVIAEIKVENDASIGAFRSAGFEYLDSKQKMIHDIQKSIPIVRYVKML